VKVALLGVRGSTPAPGPEFVRYGGHTSCVALLADDTESASGEMSRPQPPTKPDDQPVERVPDSILEANLRTRSDGAVLVLDAGTGLRSLGGLLGGRAFTGSIVLSHLHWDHVYGMPFCPSVDRPDARVDLYLPTPLDGPSPRDLLARAMSPPHFPIPPEGLLGAWRFQRSPVGPVTIEGFTVTQAEITHKGGLTHGIRVERDGVAMAYLPDHVPQPGWSAAHELARDVDLLLHDGQFLDNERATADAYGHSTVGAAVDFAMRSGARRLVMTHHAPNRSDADLDNLAADLAGSGGATMTIELAHQGDTLLLR
jgi:phosphoribosyl 1,2-cyclic phosphodiesterase